MMIIMICLTTILKKWQWLIVIGVFLFLYFLVNGIFSIYRKKKVVATLTRFCDNKGYRLIIGKRATYDYIIKTNEKNFYIKTVYVPLNAAITINSKDTWNLTYGGAHNRPGRGYSRQRYLDELKDFLRKDFNGVKLVLIYPHIDKVQKYLNESEIAILSYIEVAYGIRFMTYRDWESHFSDLI